VTVERIVSGGQTGVDRAALDAALAAGVPCGGWCPRGRRAEDGPIPARYPLEETGGAGYRERTRLNVRDSDATLILTKGALDGGTLRTARAADRLGRPVLVLDLDRMDPDDAVAAAADWIVANAVRALNVAGPRQSRCPGIYAMARRVMDRLCVRRAAIR
jgi:hypothetical protein